MVKLELLVQVERVVRLARVDRLVLLVLVEQVVRLARVARLARLARLVLLVLVAKMATGTMVHLYFINLITTASEPHLLAHLSPAKWVNICLTLIFTLT